MNTWDFCWSQRNLTCPNIEPNKDALLIKQKTKQCVLLSEKALNALRNKKKLSINMSDLWSNHKNGVISSFKQNYFHTEWACSFWSEVVLFDWSLILIIIKHRGSVWIYLKQWCISGGLVWNNVWKMRMGSAFTASANQSLI